MTATDPSDPIWDDQRTEAERWRDDWAERARRVEVTEAARQGFVLTHEQAYGLGFSRAELRRRVLRRIWWAPRRGVVAVLHPGDDARVAAALSATACALSHLRSVVSHKSAAILHGLPILDLPPIPVVTAPGRHGVRGPLEAHLTALEPDERVCWYGLAITAVPRTVVDIARSDGYDAGLVTADAAMREGLVSTTELRSAVESAAGRPGNVAARWVANNGNSLSESPLESLTRSCLLRAGLPSPQLQVTIAAAGARVDMLYPENGVVIEADGMLKYTHPAALRAEKRRQERLEQAGYRVVRVTWADVIGQPAETVNRVRRALGQRDE